MGDPARPVGDSDNPFDLGLPMVAGTSVPARKPAPPPPEPEPDDIDDEQLRGAWEDWLDDTDTEPASSVGFGEVTGWDVPDYDALDLDDGNGARSAPALIDRTGRRAGNSMRRSPRRADREEVDSRGRSGLVWSILIGLGVAVVLGALILNFVVTPGKRSTPAAAKPTPTPLMNLATTTTPSTTTTGAETTPPAAPVATAGCEQHTGSDYTSGTGPGGTSDGPAAILAFEHGYYVARSGAAARASVAPDASVPTAAAIQAGIDQMPPGVRYCVHITPAPAGGGSIWNVELTEQYPGEQPAIWHQTITTLTAGGRTLILAITQD
ncbi:hypothetical protein A5789_27215 [Nocardia sp. 852002-51101_SCH5132738]|uniref:hypothetical protein n=1 Tax=Nocardia sp. 852002-51101_SCH5132738 TaxID=1834095 RepID=UPI0007EBF5E2|nr:hypothetical protein [Nocardia sp. 852002-51101_SCH5132738]OBA51629.1 hypothetical protein A5789_27215 [Nocardia sp. 852002-51101_SCH5132738]